MYKYKVCKLYHINVMLGRGTISSVVLIYDDPFYQEGGLYKIYSKIF